MHTTFSHSTSSCVLAVGVGRWCVVVCACVGACAAEKHQSSGVLFLFYWPESINMGAQKLNHSHPRTSCKGMSRWYVLARATTACALSFQALT